MDRTELLTLLDRGQALATGRWEASLGPTRIVFGAGALAKLGDLARDLGAGCVLLVTDAGVRAAGHASRAGAVLEGAALQVVEFDGVEENPTTRHVEQGVLLAGRHPVDLIVGLGGGSVMDCAKGINFIMTNGGRMDDYWGTDRAARPMLPSIGVPTTAGTGSEAQAYALIEQEASHRKMACGDEKARFKGALLDPDLTATTPRGVAALAGLDAVSHSVESYVTTRGNPVSRRYAREAFDLLTKGLETVLDRPEDGTARGRMMLGALLAGAAIDASMLGAAHACANPLTSRYGVPHGAAVLLMLPHVVRFNEPAAGALYEELQARDASGSGGGAPALAARLEAMRERAGLPGRLSRAGVPAADLPALADEAASQWTATFNPRPVTREDLLRLYEAAY